MVKTAEVRSALLGGSLMRRRMYANRIGVILAKKPNFDSLSSQVSIL
jgi:hypothetical protein